MMEPTAGRALRTVEPQPLQQRDQLHLLHGPQGDLFDSYAARAQQLQRIDVEAVEVAVGSMILRHRDTRQRHLAGEQLSGDTVRFLLDFLGFVGERQRLLGTEDLIETGTEQGPGGLGQGEVAPEIEQGTLADAGADALGTDQTVGEVGFAVGGGAGAGAGQCRCERSWHYIGRFRQFEGKERRRQAAITKIRRSCPSAC